VLKKVINQENIMFQDGKSVIRKDNSKKIRGWDVVDAIRSLRPNAMFNLNDGKFSQYFDPDGRAVPTAEEIEAEALRLKATAYQRNRAAEYPSLLEFFDAYYWEKKGDSSKMDEYISKIEDVKSRNPKPFY
jgi:hypothetical protein